MPGHRASRPAWRRPNAASRGRRTPPAERLGPDTSVLITYADQVRAPDEAPLRTLKRLLDGPLAGTTAAVHLLPFYPSTSDDGFSVADYDAVDPAVGTWDDVAALARDRPLMFDAVINHASASHPWFQGFLAGDPERAGWFVTADPATDLSATVRPRTSPLLTPFDAADGVRHVWTTFSADQVDLEYRRPEVLAAILDVLLGYVERGARLLRLDAVTYLWKTPGTSCANLPETHEVLKLVRTALEAATPGVVMVTETNVPHAQNVGYFGDGHDEAQMVYNFALPPLDAARLRPRRRPRAPRLGGRPARTERRGDLLQLPRLARRHRRPPRRRHPAPDPRSTRSPLAWSSAVGA